MTDSASAFQTPAEALAWRARESPDGIAYIFLDAEGARSEIGYGELFEWAQAIASRARSFDCEGQPVLLLFPAGFEFLAALFGCFYAGAIAVPSYPPDPDRVKRSVPRLRAMADHAQSSLVLTTAALKRAQHSVVAEVPSLAAARWVEVDALRHPDDVFPAAHHDRTAVLQYTSGSTGRPRAVELTGRQLHANVCAVQRFFAADSQSVGVSWSPLFHDMGLIFGALTPPTVGFPSVLMSPSTFLKRPLMWLRAISDFRGTISAAPNFAYDLCVERITYEEREQLDLSSWVSPVNAAEPVRASTVHRFNRAFAPAGLDPKAMSPGWGLAEGTCALAGIPRRDPAAFRWVDAEDLEAGRITELPPGSEGAKELPSLGRIIESHEVRVVHPEESRDLGEGRIGELWIRGPCVAKGYWGEPEETERVFGGQLAGEPENRWLRTGDLGCLIDSELFVTGRIKDTIIVRGRNIYPQDLEQTAERAHESIRPGCSIAFESPENIRASVVVVSEIRPGVDPQVGEVVAAVQRAISEEHGLSAEAVLIPPGELPKTSSGKLQRRRCRQSYADRSLVVVGVAPRP